MRVGDFGSGIWSFGPLLFCGWKKPSGTIESERKEVSSVLCFGLQWVLSGFDLRRTLTGVSSCNCSLVAKSELADPNRRPVAGAEGFSSFEVGTFPAKMEKDAQRTSNNGISANSNGRAAAADGGGLLLRSTAETTRQTATGAATTPDFVLQWGSRKRPRCMKVQAKDDAASAAAHKAGAGGRVERRVARGPDKDSANPAANNHGNGNVYLNLRQRPSSPPFPPPQRVLRNSENSSAMRGQSNGGLRGFSSPDRGAHDKKGTNHHHPHPHHHSTATATATATATTNNHHHHLNSNSNHHQHNHHHNESNNKSAASSDTAHDGKKGGGGSSSGSGDAAAPPVWPPKFVIALTNKEKEEDFIIFKGSKLPQRPKKRAKMVQRTVNVRSSSPIGTSIPPTPFPLPKKEKRKKEKSFVNYHHS
ncbi:hypothetical protein BT93_F0684 [Corymbia citriodora subsp. variegata]|nr:hypothetical protein BT93_F0684 [Corymbia citriodora subsp. variegata]KAF8023254.1 hypothetical protein BT93_F0684 [Corymbia citriodora subsp. variegata]